MLKVRPSSIRNWTLTTALTGILVLGLFGPEPLLADRKKTAPGTQTKLGDQRTKAYFDVTKIVWPTSDRAYQVR